MEKPFIVYARGGGVHPQPNDPCFTFQVAAETRRDAIDKITASHPDIASAHSNCTWDAYVKI